MRKKLSIFCLITGALILSACGGKTENGDGSDSLKGGEKNGIQELPRLQVEKDTTIGGHRYKITIDRISSDSLGTVTDEMGDRYALTSLTIDVKKDGGQLFHKTLTRENFAQYLDRGFLKQSILDGCMFWGVKNGNVLFSLAVSYPDSDMSQPFLMTIDSSGGYTIAKDNSLNDEDPTASEEDNDGV